MPARLAALLAQVEPVGPAALSETVLRAVDAFAGAEPQADDVTVLSLRYGPPVR